MNKLLRRGDLVEYRSDIWIVLGEGVEDSNEIEIASLTGESRHYIIIDEVVSVGSICEMVNQLKREIES